MMPELKQLISDYLQEAFIMQLATVKGDQPWVCTVHFATDDNWNIYWISLPSRRHSVELEANHKVAGAIVLPHKHDDPPRGLQFSGSARRIIDETELREKVVHFEGKFKSGGLGEEIISGTNKHALYTIKPNIFVLFDKVNYPEDPRQEYRLVSN